MIDDLPRPEDEFGFDINSLCEFLKENVEGFELHTEQIFFDACPDDPLMNMGWGARPNARKEIEQLKKLRVSLETQSRKFRGTLGAHEDVLAKLHKSAIELTDYSLTMYDLYFGHENRGNPSWAARTVAAICYKVVEQSGRTPTLGTAATSDAPTGEYCKLVEGALKAADVNAHWNSPAKWAYAYYYDFEK
ncbi:hypothetical protein EDD53_1740 [Pacificibacter maritimus]|uniref:Uncharacterized protein n=1 Tax=Pacificibacter maritimus TaxID=762213 RepID=A0A3N4V312_9RHOB|nr:hypothetical protein [Pacificibacter maritimus]RPE67334.1 hypothetical protein EDD53_1740 [Pacificibacter maritimus]